MAAAARSDGNSSSGRQSGVKVVKRPVAKFNTFKEGELNMRVYTVLQLRDGTLLTGTHDNVIMQWTRDGSTLIRSFLGHRNGASCLIQLDDDGGDKDSTSAASNSTFVSASWDKTLKLWSLASEDCIATFEGHSKGVTCVVQLKNQRMSDEGEQVIVGTTKRKSARLIASSSADELIIVWDVDRVECVAALRGHSASVLILCELRDGTLASGSFDKTIRLWNLASGECLRTLVGHSDWVRGLAELPSPTPTRKRKEPNREVSNRSDESSDVDSDLIVSCSGDTTIRFWRVKDGVCVTVLRGHAKSYVYAIATLQTSDEEDLILVTGDSWNKCINGWNRKGELLFQCCHTSSGILTLNELVYNRDYHYNSGFYHNTSGITFACGCENGTVEIWKAPVTTPTLVELCCEQLARHCFSDVELRRDLPEELYRLCLECRRNINASNNSSNSNSLKNHRTTLFEKVKTLFSRSGNK